MSLTLFLILGISLVASLIRSTLGFGESLIAVPLFLFFLPAQVAVPLSVMLSVAIALVIVIQDHSQIHLESAKWLILYAAPGIPLGLLLLIYGNEEVIKISLGVLIILYSIYSLGDRISLENLAGKKGWIFICGFFSGILGGAYGLNGPPLVVYGHSMKWSPKRFRATLQAYFLLASAMGLAGYALKGLVTKEVGHYFLLSLIASLPAIFLGRYFNSKLKSHRFYRYVYRGVIVIGILLIGHVILEQTGISA